jgi:hypothetical protein
MTPQKERAPCQGPNLNLNQNTDEISKPSHDQQQETALGFALRAALARKAVRT